MVSAAHQWVLSQLTESANGAKPGGHATVTIPRCETLPDGTLTIQRKTSQ
jgi:hypothetical protein